MCCQISLQVQESVG
jgi:hypothetical protein